MTPAPEQVAQWAREAGMHIQYTPGMIPLFERFATLACAWQAEQDAKLCDSLEFEFRPGVNCAAAIRANAPKVTA